MTSPVRTCGGSSHWRTPALALILVSMVSPAFAARALVTLKQGSLAGIAGGIIEFRGIPFAGNSGGANRWRPPSPPPHWQGVRDASHFGPVCPQPSSHDGRDSAWLRQFTMSENCLNLTVYTPSLHPGRSLPVMVWVHGGGGRYGSGSLYDARPLAARRVVVVTLNYRLGLFGQFAYPGLNADRPQALRGNYGLMDILAALHWVQGNIASFGGNPHNVTLFGQSQGSMNVTTLMASPLSRGLFQRAIAESGAVLQLGGSARYLTRSLPNSPSLESAGIAMAHALLPGGEPVPPTALRGLSWRGILAYQQKALPLDAMPAVIDGKLLPGPIGLRFAQGKQLAIPLLIGTTSWEQSLFAHFQLPMAQILTGVPAATLRTLYPDLQGQKLVGQWLVDENFNAPVRWLADANARLGQATWVYQFDHLSPAAVEAGQPGAAHADELPYLFDLEGPTSPGFMQGRLTSGARSAAERRMTDLMVGYWTQFARNGNPNGPGLPVWPRWQPGGGGVTELLNVPVRQQAGFMGKRMAYQLDRLAQAAKSGAAH